MSASRVRLLAIAYFVLAVSLRFAAHGANINAFVALALFAGCYLSAMEGAALGLGAMALTDTMVTTSIWAHGLLRPRHHVCSVLGNGLAWVVGWLTSRLKIQWTTVFASATASAVLFFLVTNFACWLDPIMVIRER